MNRGMIDSVRACLKEQVRMDVISNNLANAGAIGFKKQRVAFQDLLERAAGGSRARNAAEPAGADLLRIEFDLGQGNLRRTENDLDMAISGEGFFKIMAEEGVKYTRKGNFKLDSEGFLATQSGDLVLGEGGPIFLGDSAVSVDDMGIVYADGLQADRLDIVRLDQPAALHGQGDTLFTAPMEAETPVPFETRIKQGYVELANVDIAEEMVSMIDSLRAFESYQKSIKVTDELNGRAINQVSRIR
ncbi:MAG: flagellar hook-basal body protein [Desulfobacteraceae bacterium]